MREHGPQDAEPHLHARGRHVRQADGARTALCPGVEQAPAAEQARISEALQGSEASGRSAGTGRATERMAGRC
ncbi:hypothetical protein ADK70_10010 [Streptomyces rimosus subsp. pseudoverticillatus]|nr:hypothetical protein ADK70_10010 [Streptomyces rimosus subsp. pseudoverticillatus]